jgi:hypothetical protein
VESSELLLLFDFLFFVYGRGILFFLRALKVFEIQTQAYIEKQKATKEGDNTATFSVSKDNFDQIEMGEKSFKFLSSELEGAETFSKASIWGTKRTPKVLINIITTLPKTDLSLISAQAARLKPVVKLPMVFLLFSPAIMAGMIQATFKLFGLLVAEGKLWTWPVLALFMFGGMITATNLTVMNLSMVLYLQLDKTAVYQSFGLGVMICAGMVFCDEDRF